MNKFWEAWDYLQEQTIHMCSNISETDDSGWRPSRHSAEDDAIDKTNTKTIKKRYRHRNPVVFKQAALTQGNSKFSEVKGRNRKFFRRIRNF